MASYNNTTHTHTLSCLKDWREYFRNFDAKHIENLVIMKITLAIVITVANGALIRSLYKQERSRTNKMFIALSISDVTIGIVSIPLTIFTLSQYGEYVPHCFVFTVFFFFQYFPFIFSWLMTIIITAERSLVVMKPAFHLKYGKKIFNISILLALILNFMFASWQAVNNHIFRKTAGANSGKNNNLTTSIDLVSIIGMIAESLLLLFMCFLQLYLMFFVRRQYQKMKENRHSANRFGSKVTKTIGLMFVSLLLCNAPHTVGVLCFVSGYTVDLVEMLYYYHVAIDMLYANSFFNAIIILTRSSNVGWSCCRR